MERGASDSSEWPSLTTLGALWLLASGALILLSGAGCTALGIGWVSGRYENPLFDTDATGRELVVVGVVQVGIAASDLAGGYGMWRGRTWGRWLGCLLGAAGLILVAWLLDLLHPGEPVAVVGLVGSGVTLLGSIHWRPRVEQPGTAA